MQVPGRGRVPVQMRAGAAVGEQRVEHLRGGVLAPGAESGEHLAQPAGEPVQAGGVVGGEVGTTRTRSRQSPLGPLPQPL